MSSGLFDVSGRLTLITGSSQGIGRALAQGLAAAGAEVVLNGRDRPSLLAAADEVRATTDGVVHAVPFDVTDAAAVAAGVALIEEAIGPIAICVNNAGVQRRAPFTELAVEDWDALLATNLTGAFLVGQQVARRMQARRRGKIINIASVQSELSRPGIAAYAATKGALKMLTRGMCADLAGSGICVNALGPGYIETDLTRSLVDDETFSSWVRGRTPAGRWGRVEDLVGTLLYLSSDASDFVHGQVVYVDGGVLSVL